MFPTLGMKASWITLVGAVVVVLIVSFHSTMGEHYIHIHTHMYMLTHTHTCMLTHTHAQLHLCWQWLKRISVWLKELGECS